MARRAFIGSVVLLLAVALSAPLACHLVYDADALDHGSKAPNDAATTTDATTDATSPSCASTRGPAMVVADGECIDATEVTVAQYGVFLDTAAPSLLPLPAPCGWLTTLEPNDFTRQQTNRDHPVVGVNYCHAYAFCAWANKRLCGKVGGGALAPGDAGMDPHDNQWLRACTHDGAQAYSYGTLASEGACRNDIREVGQPSACNGPYPGLTDMLGNAIEWVDACDDEGTTRESDGCTILGSESTRDFASCYDHDDVSRYYYGPDLGFRCCGL